MAGESSTSPAPPGSLLARLKERRDAALAESERYLDLVAWSDGELEIVARCRPLSFEEMSKLGETAARAKDAIHRLGSHCDFLARSCSEIIVRAGGEEERVADGFTDECAAALGLGTAGTAREVVRLVFRNDIAIGRAQGELFEWMSDVVQDTHRELQGESRSTRG